MEKQNQQSEFLKYESLRILIPGFYFIFLTILIVNIFNIYFFPFTEYNLIIPLILIGGIVAGLILYSLESTKKRKAFQTNLPSNFIVERAKILNSKILLTKSEAINLYYYIINNSAPKLMHDKIFTYGMLFHIINSVRRITFWFAIASTLLMSIITNNVFDFLSYRGLFIALLWVIYALNIYFNKADKKMQENYDYQILWLQMNQQLVDGNIKSYFKIKNNE